MDEYSIERLTDRVLLRDLVSLDSRDRRNAALLLSRIAGVDGRKLYVAAGYSSMIRYCIGELNHSEDVASKRIWAARTARRFPVIFHAIAEGRLNVTGVYLLARHLTPENADEKDSKTAA